MSLTPQEQRILDALGEQFLEPDAQRFGAEDFGPNDPPFDGYDGPGWYARLSAPGYLDCTDWTGPFTSETLALRHLVELYGDEVEIDEDGEA